MHGFFGLFNMSSSNPVGAALRAGPRSRNFLRGKEFMSVGRHGDRPLQGLRTTDKLPLIFWPFIAFILSACVDYVKIAEDSDLGDTFRFGPIIDTKHLSPHPSRLYETISVGKNCRGVVFLVPPIEDRNRKDRLYYLWFLDNRLAGPRSIIEPDSRKFRGHKFTNRSAIFVVPF